MNKESIIDHVDPAEVIGTVENLEDAMEGGEFISGDELPQTELMDLQSRMFLRARPNECSGKALCQYIIMMVGFILMGLFAVLVISVVIAIAKRTK